MPPGCASSRCSSAARFASARCTTRLKLPQPTVSRHLAYLRRAGLVETRREGLWIHYRLASLDDTVLRTLTDIVKHALTHVDTIARDGERLRKATGCCLKAVEAPRSLACCGEEVHA